jgi:hypothetical protein
MKDPNRQFDRDPENCEQTYLPAFHLCTEMFMCIGRTASNLPEQMQAVEREPAVPFHAEHLSYGCILRRSKRHTIPVL